MIQGDGAEVKKGQTITAHYVGQVYPDGEVFDSSWTKGPPASFSLDQVIKCWKDLIPGQKVGSRIVLVCPADTAYGDSPQEGGGSSPATRWCLPSTCSTHPDILLPWPSARPRG